MSKINSFEETAQETADRYVTDFNRMQRFINGEENDEEDREYIETENRNNIMDISELEGQ